MKFGRQFAVFVVAMGLLLTGACKKNKPQLPAKMLAPTLAVGVPDQIPEETPPPEPPGRTTGGDCGGAAKEEATGEAPPKEAKHRLLTKTQGNTTVAVNRPPANPATEATMDTAIAADVTSQTASPTETDNH